MKFMVEGTLAQALTPELMALVPAETARGKELDAQGLRTAFSTAADYSKFWQTFVADTREEVQRALESLALYHVMTYTIIALAPDQA
ncbi:MAG: hypothetical protein H0X37_06210 [Herpetosiphonaceae bacterium]|nr:hypothetical protein [Herpetosiphonaceae bacterium]